MYVGKGSGISLCLPDGGVRGGGIGCVGGEALEGVFSCLNAQQLNKMLLGV